MRCLLVMPAWHPEDVFSKEFVDSQLTLWHPTGLMYVAASLQKAGHEVKLVDGAFQTRDQIRQVMKEFGPGFVGLYSNIPLWQKTRNTVEDAKEIDPSLAIPMPSILPCKYHAILVGIILAIAPIVPIAPDNLALFLHTPLSNITLYRLEFFLK